MTKKKKGGIVATLSLDKSRGIPVDEFCALEKIVTKKHGKGVMISVQDKNGIPYDYINQNPNQPPEINPSKPVADYYIDDRAVTFTTWDEVLDEIKHREKHDPYYKVIQR